MQILPEKIIDAIVAALPIKKSRRGRPEKSKKKTIKAIFYVLKTGIQWRFLPRYYGKPSTIHGKFIQWCRSGVWEHILEVVRKQYDATYPDINWYAIDTCSRKAPFARQGGKNPTDRAK